MPRRSETADTPTRRSRRGTASATRRKTRGRNSETADSDADPVAEEIETTTTTTSTRASKGGKKGGKSGSSEVVDMPVPSIGGSAGGSGESEAPRGRSKGKSSKKSGGKKGSSTAALVCPLELTTALPSSVDNSTVTLDSVIKGRSGKGLEGISMAELEALKTELATVHNTASQYAAYVEGELAKLNAWHDAANRGTSYQAPAVPPIPGLEGGGTGIPAPVTSTSGEGTTIGEQLASMTIAARSALSAARLSSARGRGSRPTVATDMPPAGSDSTPITIRIKPPTPSAAATSAATVPSYATGMTGGAGYQGAGGGKSGRGAKGGKKGGGRAKADPRVILKLSMPKESEASEATPRSSTKRKRQRKSKKNTAERYDPVSEPDSDDEFRRSPSPPNERPEQGLWATVDEYWANIEFDDLKALLPQGERTGDSSFVVPGLGSNPDLGYDFDGDDSDDGGHQPRKRRRTNSYTPSGMTKSTSRTRNTVAPKDRVEMGDMTSRLVGGLVAQSSADKFDTGTPSEYRREILEQGGYVPDSSIPSMEALEKRVRQELLAVGLLDSPHVPPPEDREDDEVCVELRRLQKKLTLQIRANNERKARLYTMVCSYLPEQRRKRKRMEADRAVLRASRTYLGKQEKTRIKRRPDIERAMRFRLNVYKELEEEAAKQTTKLSSPAPITSPAVVSNPSPTGTTTPVGAGSRRSASRGSASRHSAGRPHVAAVPTVGRGGVVGAVGGGGSVAVAANTSIAAQNRLAEQQRLALVKQQQAAAAAAAAQYARNPVVNISNANTSGLIVGSTPAVNGSGKFVTGVPTQRVALNNQQLMQHMTAPRAAHPSMPNGTSS